MSSRQPTSALPDVSLVTVVTSDGNSTQTLLCNCRTNAACMLWMMIIHCKHLCAKPSSGCKWRWLSLSKLRDLTPSRAHGLWPDARKLPVLAAKSHPFQYHSRMWISCHTASEIWLWDSTRQLLDLLSCNMLSSLGQACRVVRRSGGKMACELEQGCSWNGTVRLYNLRTACCTCTLWQQHRHRCDCSVLDCMTLAVPECR